MNTIPILCLAALSLAFISGCGSGDDATIESSGILEAVEVNVSSRVSGVLLRLSVDEGSAVEAGDTIAVIDTETLQLQLRHAEAGVDLAQAQYQLLKNGARTEDLHSAEEAVRQTEASYKAAKSDFDRIKELYSTHAVSAKQFEDAESRVTISLAQLNAAKQNLQKVQRFARAEELAAAAARVEQARAQAALVRKQINDSYILAPLSGTVTHQPVEVGELVGPGSVVARVARTGTMELMIYVNETELGKVTLGGSADVTIDTFPDKKYPASVVYVSPVAEFTPRNVQTKDERTKLVFGVKLDVDNPAGELKSGMPADAVLR